MKKLLVVISLWWLVGLVVVGYTIPALVGYPTGRATAHPYQAEYEKMLYPTVRITTPSGVGSGVVINHQDSKGTKDPIYLLTAAHVVGDESKVTVSFYNYETSVVEIKSAQVVITDTIKDLALLKINQPYPYVAPLASRHYQPYIFTPVWVVGCSLGLPPRPSEGIITRTDCGRRIDDGGLNPKSAIRNPPSPYWEVSAPILPGNSGGPVFDAQTYEVIGLAVWVRVYRGQLITTMAGVVPVSVIYDFLDEVDK